MTNRLMEISGQEFEQMRKLIYDRFGIHLTDQKKGLLVTRLQRHLQALGFKNFNNYYEYLVKDKSEKELGNLIDRVSTNHTFFNREKDHFKYYLKNALPAVISSLKKQNRKDLRVWCAGCSSGEEAYMLLMLLHECLGGEYDRWDAGILATDISNKALATARAGYYTDERIKDVPEPLKKKYFRQRDNGGWLVNEGLKNEATFRRFNLMNQQFPFKKPFQIIFCRNVMIYFDQPTRENLIRKFHQFTETQGYLFIGHSETLGRNNNLYKYILPAAYQKESGL